MAELVEDGIFAHFVRQAQWHRGAGREVQARAIYEAAVDWRYRNAERKAEKYLALMQEFDAAAPAPPAPEVLSVHRCKICGTRWLLWPDSVHGGGWNLLDKWQRPGSCCDNVPMGEQIEHLRDIDLSGASAPSAGETAIVRWSLAYDGPPNDRYARHVEDPNGGWVAWPHVERLLEQQQAAREGLAALVEEIRAFQNAEPLMAIHHFPKSLALAATVREEQGNV